MLGGSTEWVSDRKGGEAIASGRYIVVGVGKRSRVVGWSTLEDAHAARVLCGEVLVVRRTLAKVTRSQMRSVFEMATRLLLY